MRTNVTCDASIIDPGAAVVSDVTLNGCEYVISMRHNAGCPIVNLDIEKAKTWISENEWVVGCVYLVAGPLIALFGAQWFPWVTAALVAIFVMGLITMFSLSVGWMATSTGSTIVIITAFLLGIIAGSITRRNIWLMFSLLGLVSGFFSGSLIYALGYEAWGWNEVWIYWVVASSFAIVGCLAACKLGASIVVTSTALVGSYLFMRSWTMFFPGHYPSESELIDDTGDATSDPVFWAFFCVFIVSFMGSMTFQMSYGEKHSDLYERKDD